MAQPAAQDLPAVDFDCEHVLAAAVATAGTDDFGDPRFADDVRAYLTAIQTEADVSAVGGLGLQALVHQLLVNRLRYHSDLTAHPEIAAEVVADPIVITGLFRTGTTKLQRMLSADPGVQRLTFWRIFNPAPIPGSAVGEPDPRIALAAGYVEALSTGAPEFMAAHAWIADEPDEDSLLLWLTFNHLAGASVGYIPSFVKRVQSRSQRSNYDYLAGVLRYLQWQDGGRQQRPWVLKSPTHVGNVEPILGAFPMGTLVFCHRDPVVVVASFVRLFEIFWGLFGNSVDPKKVGPVMLDLWAGEMVKGLAQRDQLGDDPRIIDVDYDDIVARPLEVIGRIYDQHGLAVTPDAEQAFTAWETSNPQHRFGKHEYSLEACGLTESRVEQAFAPYLERFVHLRP
jgi:Sulfotransferase family